MFFASQRTNPHGGSVHNLYSVSLYPDSRQNARTFPARTAYAAFALKRRRCAVLYFRRGGAEPRPCTRLPNVRHTAQRCHSEPVRRLAWESVPLASLFGGALFFVKTRRSTEGLLCVCRSAAATYRRKCPAAFGGALFFVKTRRSTEGILCVCRSAAATYRRKSPAAFGGALFFVKTRRSTEGILCVCRSAATMYWRKRAAAYTPSPSNAGVYASSAEVRSCTNPSVMPQFRI